MCRSLYRLTDEILDLPEGGKRIPPPWCASCGGRVRPGVVWFGETLPQHAWQPAAAAARDRDAFLVIGTSAIVQPAVSLVHVARNAGGLTAQITLIRKASTKSSRLRCRGGLGTYFARSCGANVEPRHGVRGSADCRLETARVSSIRTPSNARAVPAAPNACASGSGVRWEGGIRLESV